LEGEAINTRFVYFSEHCDIIPVEVDNTEDNLLSITSYTENSYGLGIDFSIIPDQTAFIQKNRLSFAETLQLQFNYDMLEMFQLNPDNTISSMERHMASQQITDLLAFELKSDAKHSLVTRLTKSYDKLVKSFENGDKVFENENNFIEFNSYG
jgi:hypothetical protein